MTLLIDADWLVFSSCCAGEVEIQWDTWNHTLHSNAKDCLAIIEARLEVYKTIAKAQQA